MSSAKDPTPRVLVVDDDDTARSFIARTLARQGFDAVAAEGGRQAIVLMEDGRFDAIVCDLLMPEVDGLDVLRYAAGLSPAPPFIMLTAHGNIGVAVDAMKLGAFDFLEKPLGGQQLEAALRSAIGRRRADSRSTSRGQPLRSTLVGSESWLRPFSELLEKIATTDAIVLIEGETGTGKSAVAREIWRLSRRSKGPLIEVNCAAFNRELIERELFGDIKGAFTGALGQAGKVEKASGGTLFLDEIGELPLESQAKLLHLLQERTFTRVGGNTPQRADVRFIAATNRRLEQEARNGTFRSDLYFRLEVVKLTIPPLRDRIEDVPVLLATFGRMAAERNGRAPSFPPETIDALCRYEWPGNVRELENLVARLSVMLEDGEAVRLEHLPERIQKAAGARPRAGDEPGGELGAAPTATIASGRPDAPVPPAIEEVEASGLAMAMKRYESDLIRHALEVTKDNTTKAAKLLRMKRTTLIEKRKRYEDLGLL